MKLSNTPHPLLGQFKMLSICYLEDAPYVTAVYLNRPQKRNAIDARVSLFFLTVGLCCFDLKSDLPLNMDLN